MWRRILAGVECNSRGDSVLIAQLKAEVPTGTRDNTSDGVNWRWGEARRFSVKSVYNFLQNGGVAETRFSKVWRIKASIKVKIFVWLVLRKRVLTIDNLLKRGWCGADVCALCSEEGETVNHLFWRCRTTNQLLHAMLANKVFLRSCENPASLWEECAKKGGSLGWGELLTLASVWWSVWLERKKRIFEQKRQEPKRILVGIRALRSDWASCCSS